MPVETWAAFVATVFVLTALPGPSQLVMTTSSLRHGFRRGLAVAAGDLSANLLQALAAGLGLAAVVATSGPAFTALKWAGVAYLVVLGIRTWSARPPRPGAAPEHPSLRRLYLRGFITSASNPKAVLFFAALFPQFLDPALPIAPQLTLLTATYLAVDGTVLSAYGATAGTLAQRVSPHAHRIGAVLIIVAAVLLGGVGLHPETKSEKSDPHLESSARP